MDPDYIGKSTRNISLTVDFGFLAGFPEKKSLNPYIPLHGGLQQLLLLTVSSATSQHGQ